MEDVLIVECVMVVRCYHQAKTAQFASLFDDFCYWDVDYCIYQHPFTIWCTYLPLIPFDALRLVSAKKLYFSGGLYYEPIVNQWATSVRSEQEFLQKYQLGSGQKICLVLRWRHAGMDNSFAKIIKSLEERQYEILVKPHPWEYKALLHGTDTRCGGDDMR